MVAIIQHKSKTTCQALGLSRGVERKPKYAEDELAIPPTLQDT